MAGTGQFMQVVLTEVTGYQRSKLADTVRSLEAMNVAHNLCDLSVPSRYYIYQIT